MISVQILVMKLFRLFTYIFSISMSRAILFVYVIENSDTVPTSSWPSYWEKTESIVCHGCQPHIEVYWINKRKISFFHSSFWQKFLTLCSTSLITRQYTRQAVYV